MIHSAETRDYNCTVYHLETYAGSSTVTASNPEEALAKLRRQVDEGDVFFQDFCQAEEPNEFRVEDEDGKVVLTHEEPGHCLHAQRRLVAELLEALEAQAMAEADPEASERKGYFEHARKLRHAALQLARRPVR